jgi:hypothetical protein
MVIMDMAVHSQPLHTGLGADTMRTATVAHSLTALAVYQLSEAGRKASLLSGGDGLGWQRLSVQVPASRLHLVAVDMHGVARLRLQPRFERTREDRVARHDSPPTYDAPPTLEDLFRDAARNHELERAYQLQRTAPQERRREAEQARRTQVAVEFLADVSRRAMSYPRPTATTCVLGTPSGQLIFDSKADIGPARELPAEAYRRFQADFRARRTQNLARRDEEQATNEARKRAIQEWIAGAGTEEQRARHAAGLLPLKEAMEGLTDEAFSSLNGQPRYEPIDVATFQAYLRAETGRGDLVVAPVDLEVAGIPAASATAAQWAVVEHLKSVFPDASVTLRDHRLSWRRDPDLPTMSQQGALVVRRVGPFLLRREFAVPAR